MTVVSFAFITGFMVGIEFPGAGEEAPWLVIDLGIVRILFDKIEFKDEE